MFMLQRNVRVMCSCMSLNDCSLLLNMLLFYPVFLPEPSAFAHQLCQSSGLTEMNEGPLFCFFNVVHEGSELSHGKISEYLRALLSILSPNGIFCKSKHSVCRVVMIKIMAVGNSKS